MYSIAKPMLLKYVFPKIWSNFIIISKDIEYLETNLINIADVKLNAILLEIKKDTIDDLSKILLSNNKLKKKFLKIDLPVTLQLELPLM